jgi:hypothetical protein
MYDDPQPQQPTGGTVAPLLQPRHLATGPEDPRSRGSLVRTPPMVRKHWQWLLVIPGILPLLVPLYNRTDPVLWGLPFFYWFQIACGALASVLVTIVYQATKGR